MLLAHKVIYFLTMALFALLAIRLLQSTTFQVTASKTSVNPPTMISCALSALLFPREQAWPGGPGYYIARLWRLADQSGSARVSITILSEASCLVTIFISS